MSFSLFGTGADVFDKIKKMKIIPVVTLKNPDDALHLAKALIGGGLPCAEITFRTDAAEESIRRITAEHPDMLIGAGTVLSIEQADKAMAAGAKFAVSPGFNPKVVLHCVEKQFPFIPGCMTPSDIERALELGLVLLKFFPAEAAGGLKLLKALSAPYPSVRFMPTGGITELNVGEYLAFDKVIACGGSFMATDKVIDAGEFDKIAEITARTIKML